MGPGLGRREQRRRDEAGQDQEQAGELSTCTPPLPNANQENGCQTSGSPNTATNAGRRQRDRGRDPRSRGRVARALRRGRAPNAADSASPAAPTIISTASALIADLRGARHRGRLRDGPGAGAGFAHAPSRRAAARAGARSGLAGPRVCKRRPRARGRRPPRTSGPFQIPPLHASVPAATTTRGLWHRLVGPQQRRLHRSGDRPCDQEDVGMAGRSREEQPQPLHVVVRVQQRGDLLLDRSIGAGVDMADVKRATKDPAQGAGGDVGVSSVVADDESGAAAERRARSRHRSSASRPGRPSTHKPQAMHRLASSRIRPAASSGQRVRETRLASKARRQSGSRQRGIQQRPSAEAAAAEAPGRVG